MHFTDANNGWAVGDGGTILKTIDGGATWAPQTSGTPTQVLTGVHFTDANNGWAVGSGGTILNTNDGGATWAPQTSGTPTQVPPPTTEKTVAEKRAAQKAAAEKEAAEKEFAVTATDHFLSHGCDRKKFGEGCDRCEGDVNCLFFYFREIIES